MWSGLDGPLATVGGEALAGSAGRSLGGPIMPHRASAHTWVSALSVSSRARCSASLLLPRLVSGHTNCRPNPSSHARRRTRAGGAQNVAVASPAGKSGARRRSVVQGGYSTSTTHAHTGAAQGFTAGIPLGVSTPRTSFRTVPRTAANWRRGQLERTATRYGSFRGSMEASSGPRVRMRSRRSILDVAGSSTAGVRVMSTLKEGVAGMLSPRRGSQPRRLSEGFSGRAATNEADGAVRNEAEAVAQNPWGDNAPLRPAKDGSVITFIVDNTAEEAVVYMQVDGVGQGRVWEGLPPAGLHLAVAIRSHGDMVQLLSASPEPDSAAADARLSALLAKDEARAAQAAKAAASIVVPSRGEGDKGALLTDSERQWYQALTAAAGARPIQLPEFIDLLGRGSASASAAKRGLLLVTKLVVKEFTGRERGESMCNVAHFFFSSSMLWSLAEAFIQALASNTAFANLLFTLLETYYRTASFVEVALKLILQFILKGTLVLPLYHHHAAFYRCIPWCR